MNWYRMVYENHSGSVDQPDQPRPTGIRLLGYVFAKQWWNLICLNILFWAFCLPIVTIPAAAKAMTRVCVTMLETDSVDLWQEFRHTFREDFFRTTGVGFAMAAVITLCGTGLWFCMTQMAENGIWAAPALLLLIALAVSVMSLFSLFPMLAFSELKAGKLVSNAVLLALVDWKHHLEALLLLAVLICVYFLCFPYSTVALAAILLSAFCLCACFLVWPGIKRYVFQK